MRACRRHVAETLAAAAGVDEVAVREEACDSGDEIPPGGPLEGLDDVPAFENERSEEKEHPVDRQDADRRQQAAGEVDRPRPHLI